MAEPELPRGRYLTVAYQVHPEAGGQTRAMLMRNRILAQQGGVRPEVLALGPAPDSEARRAALLGQGALIEEIATRNLYDHYREHGWGDEPPRAELPDLTAHRIDEQPRADGSVLRVVYQPPAGRQGLRLPARGRHRVPPGRRPQVLAQAELAAEHPARRGGRAGVRRVHQPAGAAPPLAGGADAGRRARLRLHRLALRAPAPRAAARPADAVALPGPQPPPPAAGTPLGRPDGARLPARAQACLRRRRLRDAHRPPARRDRRAPRAHDQHARRPEPGHRPARAGRAARPRPAARDRARPALPAEAARPRRGRVGAGGRGGAGRAARDLRRGQGARPRRGGDRRARAGGGGADARVRSGRARRAVDVECAAADERLRGLPALDARGDGPGLPGRRLRRPLRPARAGDRRGRRLRRGRRGRRRARGAGGGAAPLARARRAR